MNLRRAALAAALAFTSVLPATPVEAAPSAPAAAGATALSAGLGATAAPAVSGATAATAVPGAAVAGAVPGSTGMSAAQRSTGMSAAPRGWPFPPINLSGLVPGLYAVNVHSFQCLSAPAAGGPASQRRCVVDDAYRWKLVPASLDARFKVQNAGSGRCLVPAGGLGLALAACGNAMGDTWRLKDAPGTGIYVVNAATGRCLTVSPNGYAVQYRCDGAISRRWTFRAKPNGPGVVNVNGGKP